jgi:hypothetical protein
MLNVIDFGNLLFVNEIIVVVENLGERFWGIERVAFICVGAHGGYKTLLDIGIHACEIEQIRIQFYYIFHSNLSYALPKFY